MVRRTTPDQNEDKDAVSAYHSSSITREICEQPEGIIVPLDLPEFKILDQQVPGDGSIEVHVIARINREACPRCRQICVKVHDTRRRVKRDIRLRTYQIRLVVYKRRFCCLACKRSSLLKKPTDEFLRMRTSLFCYQITTNRSLMKEIFDVFLLHEALQ